MKREKVDLTEGRVHSVPSAGENGGGTEDSRNDPNGYSRAKKKEKKKTTKKNKKESRRQQSGKEKGRVKTVEKWKDDYRHHTTGAYGKGIG